MYRVAVLALLALSLTACDWFVPEARAIDFEVERLEESVDLVFVPYVFEPPEPDPREVLARCLTDRGVVLYSTTWCGPCRRQKAMFGPYVSLLTNVDCGAEPECCRVAGVRSVPTWIFPDGSHHPGVRGLSQLARRAHCPYSAR